MGDILSLLGMLLVIAVILVLTYWATRLIAARSSGGFTFVAGDRRMRVVEQLPVGKDQKLLVVRIGERCFLLGVAAEITLLAELSPEEAAAWPQAPENNVSHTLSFRDALRTCLKDRGRK